MKRGLWYSNKVTSLCNKDLDFAIELGLTFTKRIAGTSKETKSLIEASAKKEFFKTKIKVKDVEMLILADFKERSIGIILAEEYVEVL